MGNVRRLRATVPKDRRTANMKFRTSGNLRQRIDAAAADAGRTSSCEVERRLERSFLADDLRTLIREEIRAALAEQRTSEDGNHLVRPGYDFLRNGPPNWIV